MGSLSCSVDMKIVVVDQLETVFELNLLYSSRRDVCEHDRACISVH